MSMAWFAILALVASPDGHPCRSDREPARQLAVSVGRLTKPGPSYSPALGRNVGHRRCSSPWSAGSLDEFDTEESDETWMVDLDLLASVPVAWLDWARPSSPARSDFVDDPAPPAPSSIPLRC